MRIQKFLSDVGFCSRGQAEKFIRAGRIMVNGHKAQLGDKVSEKDTIVVDGRKIEGKKIPKKVLVFHKPVGVDCTLVANPWGKTLVDFDFGPDRVFPIGRLDIDAHGLLLLTNDGELGNRLSRPSAQHDEEYLLTVKGKLTPEITAQFKHGTVKGKTLSPPYRVEQIHDHVLKLTLHEGRSKLIRKMCDGAGIQIKELQRIRVGMIELGELEEGSWRLLNDHEYKVLQKEGVSPSGRRRIVPGKR